MIFFLLCAIGFAAYTVWLGFIQFNREGRRILGTLLYLSGSIPIVTSMAAIFLIVINSFYPTSGENLDWGPFGFSIITALSIIICGGALCFVAMFLTPVWILISKKYKAQQDAAANP